LTYIVNESCIKCKYMDCVEVCPVDCIHDEGDEDLKLYINPDECIDCGACEPACPVAAIFTEDTVPANLKEYTEIDAVWYKDKPAARAKVEAIKPI